MHNPLCEISKYGTSRLRKIAIFIKHGGAGYQYLFGTKTWDVEFTNNTGRRELLNTLALSGAFEYVAHTQNESWETLLANLATHKLFLIGLCNLFGMDRDVKKLSRRDVGMEEGMFILHKIVNKLSNVYVFNGDPLHPLSRRKMNDIRLNCLFKRKMFGKEALTIAKTVTTFKDAITDPYIRTIFWSNYTPGTGLFSISFSNLDQISDIDDCCSICLEVFNSDIPGVKLHPCGHVFHPPCIQEMIINVSGDDDVSCPLCRSKVNDL